MRTAHNKQLASELAGVNQRKQTEFGQRITRAKMPGLYREEAISDFVGTSANLAADVRMGCLISL
jgi:hypothetical protein